MVKNISGVLKGQLEKIKPDEKELRELKKKLKDFILFLKSEIRKSRYAADVFIGGSFAKGTLIRKDKYDVDIFVRFDWRYDNISDMLEKMLKKASKSLKIERLHGSRDYFRVYFDEDYYLELIPVSRIKKPREARNVTDLSYFHVPYVKKRIKGKEDELRLIKTFCHAQKVYGAETYVHGFSGYALECLVIFYGSFVKILRELSRVKVGERKIIDIEKHYKRQKDVFIDLNESKLHSPVILIDPTYKERNALASLSYETFKRFQTAAKKFLKSPNEKFFVEQPINAERLEKKSKKIGGEFVKLKVKTDKQAGDIAGTKLKKFSEVLEREVGRYFEVKETEFEYDDEQSALLYFVLKSRKEVVRIGPPLHLKKFVRNFKKEHMNTYEKNGMVHARIKVNFGACEFIDIWKKSNRKMLKEMGITGMRVLG